MPIFRSLKTRLIASALCLISVSAFGSDSCEEVQPNVFKMTLTSPLAIVSATNRVSSIREDVELAQAGKPKEKLTLVKIEMTTTLLPNDRCTYDYLLTFSSDNENDPWVYMDSPTYEGTDKPVVVSGPCLTAITIN